MNIPHYKTIEQIIMSPSDRVSPLSVIDLTHIITIGVRDWDISETIDMYMEHCYSMEERYGSRETWALDIIQRLNYIRCHGVETVEWIPDCNDGVYICTEEWFVRYGFAPDMIVNAQIAQELVEIDIDGVDWDLFNGHDTETTCSVTITSADV